MFTALPGPLHLPPLEGAADRDRVIVATLLYFDLFHFPLRAEELVRFAHRGGEDGHFGERDLAGESPWWSCCGEYWHLKGRDGLAARRASLAEASQGKLVRARRLARWLQLIPGVRFIGVTGSLAMESAVADDDIDLLVITARGRLWLTRALVLAALWGLGVKRPDDGRQEHPDQVCANIFLREDGLEIPDHNLFIAHEICQMQPLLGPATYNRFLSANSWVCEYLPQWQPAPCAWQDRRSLRALQRALEISIGGPVREFVERELARRQLARIQHKHARGHNVGVKISATQLRFHPRDLSQYVVEAFDARWQELERGDQPG